MPVGRPSEVRAEALGLVARGAIVEMRPRLAKEAITELADCGDGRRAELLHRLWKGFYNAIYAEAGIVDTTLEQEARDEGVASIVVDATLLQAVLAMRAEEHDEALALTRRAARMAQSEHLWVNHYFTSMFLARLRRLRGACHLATQIAVASCRAMPQLWHGWFQWEMTCAGGTSDTSAGTSPMASAHRAMRAYLGDRSVGLKVPEEVRQSALHRADVETALLLWGEPSQPDASSLDWSCGSTNIAPPGIFGLLLAGDGAAGAHVSVTPKGDGFAARRVVPRLLDESFALGKSKAQPTRVSTLICALALAGADGLSRTELFEQIYGFPYRAELHDIAFRVLRSYAKSHLGDAGTLKSSKGRHYLLPLRSFSITDPRTVRPLGDLMLRFLARSGGTSAKKIAGEVGVSLRKAQLILKDMVGEGACTTRREGRNLTYEVQDTTFIPLTMV